MLNGASGSIDNPTAGERWELGNWQLPYPNAPHDGGAQDQANTQYIVQMGEKASGIDYKISSAAPATGLDAAILDLSLAVGSLGLGAAIAAPVAAAAGGGVAGAAAGGAAAGASTGALNASVTGGNIGKGILMGGLTGALGGVAAPLSNSLGSGISSTTGLGTTASNALASGIVKGGIGAGLGSISSAVNSGNVGNSALSGGVGGFLSGAVGNATGSSALGSAASKLGGYALSPLLSSGTTTSSAPSAQGNIGNMSSTSVGSGVSTDSSLASTITGALPGVLSTAAGVYGAQNQAEAITSADNNAINTQSTALGNINNIWGTQQALGQGADTALGSALGTNGQPANYSGFENMPGYQFAVNQGTQAIQRQAASQGSAYTPNTSIAVGNYVTGTAMTDYNTYINQLMGAAGLGTTANQGLQTGTQTTANNISTLQQNQGLAQGAGVAGSANAIGSAFGASGVGTGLLNGVLGGTNANSSGVPGSSASNVGTGVTGSTEANAFGNYNNTSANAAESQNFVGDTSTLPYTDPSNLVDDNDLTSFLGSDF